MRLLTGIAAICAVDVLVAQGTVTPEQRKELTAIRRDVIKVKPLLRRKQVVEAKELVARIEGRIEKLGIEDGEKDRVYRRVVKDLAAAKAAMPVSFEAEIAPILKNRCLVCHAGSEAQGRRPLDTWRNMSIRGPRGPLLVRGNARRSLLINVVLPRNLPQNLSQQQRQALEQRLPPHMPQRGQDVPRDDIESIARWINQGAKFDGTDPNAVIGTSKPADGTKPADENPSDEPERPEDRKVEIAMATGDETVSFTKDVAPFLVNICMRCHNDRRKRGGYSMATFEKFMQGGESAVGITPGSLDESYVWALAGEQDPMKMPPGQLLITRSNHASLRKWIEEGAKFDGKDADAPLRSLVPTEAEKRAAELASMTPQQLAERRMTQATDAWKRVMPKQALRTVETTEFLVVGNVPDARLEEVGKWAEQQAMQLRSMFNEKGGLLWRGRLTIHVLRDRFDYVEFNQVLLRRRIPGSMTGHSVVRDDMAEAYVVVQDIGDDVTSELPGLRVNVVDHVTGAFLKRRGGDLPDWIVSGLGLSLAARTDPSNDYVRNLSTLAAQSVSSLTDGDELFADGEFSPSAVGPVGYTLVNFLLKRDGVSKFGQLVTQIESGTRVHDAISSVYRVTAANLATSYRRSLGNER